MGVVKLEGGTTPIFQNLYTRLATFDGAKDAFAEVIARYGEGEINEANARTLSYLLSNYLAYWRHADDLRIEDRLDVIERQLEGRRGVA